MLKADGNGLPHFQYNANDFNDLVTIVDGGSKFDDALVEKWEVCQKIGIFNYILNIREQKILPGKYAFVIQLNPDRGAKRRKPDDIESMSQPFDPNKFNFNKISNTEILFDIGYGDGSDIVAVNNSPIEHCHSLLITDRFKCLPQKVTAHSLRRAIDVLLLSKSPYLKLIFNSLGAHASVNHLHWHLFYLRYEMPLEYIEVDHLKGPIHALTAFPSKGFCLKLSACPDRVIGNLVSWTYSIVKYLQTARIAHNICIMRARQNQKVEIYDDIRVYVWARSSSLGVKSTNNLVPAVCELLGYISIKTEGEYQFLNEDAVAILLNEVTSETFNFVKEKLSLMEFNENGTMVSDS